ncbi:MAG: ABC transporter ATP-binding protein, partial [Burkholderiales bacterium]|nr:ABC transporter ATP-binding protein [Burkholderiales bacterium]
MMALHSTALVKRFTDKTSKRTQVALNGVSISVAAGSLTALVGPDGAGKTTFLRMAAGLIKPDGGSLHVLGIDVASDPQQVQNRISYMPQRFGLYEDLSVQENLDLYADLHGVPHAERQRQYARLLEMTDMAAFTDRLAGQLSGGMKQKLGLACTLVRAPELLLLDEPTVGVDPLSRKELWAIVQQLVDSEGLSVLLSTAYLDEAERCEQVVLMREGSVLAYGHPQSISDQAAGRCYVATPAAGVSARTLQSRLLDDSTHIVDAVPHAGEVHFICQTSFAAEAQVKAIPSLAGAPLHSVPARLEDGFMV